MEFTWNKERKKFVSPTGQILQGKEVLEILNTMLDAIQRAEYAYGALASIFALEEVADGDNDSGNMEQQGEAGEVDSERPEQGVGGRTASE